RGSATSNCGAEKSPALPFVACPCGGNRDIMSSGTYPPSPRTPSLPVRSLSMSCIRKRSLLALGVGFALLTMSLPTTACPFCNQSGQTLTGDLNQATMVLYGKMKNKGDGTTILEVEAVIKDNDFRKGQTTIELGQNFDP